MASENEKHSKIPIFSGNREDFEDWIFDVNLWMGTTGRKKEEQAPAPAHRRQEESTVIGGYSDRWIPHPRLGAETSHAFQR